MSKRNGKVGARLLWLYIKFNTITNPTHSNLTLYEVYVYLWK